MLIATEGWIRIKPDGNIYVGCYNSRKELIDYFNSFYPGYVRERVKEGYKTIYETEVSGEVAYQCICDILSYLKIKQTRAKIAKLIYEFKQLFGYVPNNVREICYHKMKELNKKGT